MSYGAHTRGGRELADLLTPYLLPSKLVPAAVMRCGLVSACSLIARHAATHRRLCEAECNRELTPRERRLLGLTEARLAELVGVLPRTPNGPITLRLQGDPRGYTVKLHVPGLPQGGNTWGLDGDFGVGGSK